MTFYQAYNWLLSLSNIPRKEYMTDPRKCGWYLKRLQFFFDILGNPEKKIPHYIHVTGTSGKGSVVSYLHSILETQGKLVGSTYSPHPTCITERWKIGNTYMTKREFVELVEYIKPMLDKYIRTTPYDMLSFFELTEAIGFVYFARKKVTWAVLEVACGGRYDASNIIPYKDVAVITNVGLDHVGIIGNNKKEIAHEKVGIIKRGNTVFTQETNKDILKIIQNECKKQKASLKISNYKSQILKQNLDESIFNYDDNQYKLKTLGKHQVKNAILCINIAKHLGISNNVIRRGLTNAHQPLRMETVAHNPLIILDGAHNPDKMRTTVQTIKDIRHPIYPAQSRLSRGAGENVISNIHLIVGFSGDKNIRDMIRQLSALKPKSIAVTRNTTNPFRKVADLQEVNKKFKQILPKTKTRIFLDPHDALEWIKKQSKREDIILSTGSIFVSGEFRISSNKH